MSIKDRHPAMAPLFVCNLHAEDLCSTGVLRRCDEDCNTDAAMGSALMQGPDHGHDEHPQRFLSNMVVTSKVHVTTLHDCLLLSNQPSLVMDCNLIRAAHLG